MIEEKECPCNDWAYSEKYGYERYERDDDGLPKYRPEVVPSRYDAVREYLSRIGARKLKREPSVYRAGAWVWVGW